MIDFKKKCWREKVTAEITLAHLQQFAREMGTDMSATEVAAFLNEKGRAQSMWTHMMQAGEKFIKASLEDTRSHIPAVNRSGASAPLVH